MLARSASRVENMLFPNISSVTEIISAERVRRTERANRTGMPWRSVVTGAKSTPEYTQREVLNHRKAGQWKNFLNDCLKGVWQLVRSHPRAASPMQTEVGSDPGVGRLISHFHLSRGFAAAYRS